MVAIAFLGASLVWLDFEQGLAIKNKEISSRAREYRPVITRPRVYLLKGGCQRDSAMLIDRLDYLVLTVSYLEATVAFYARVMGMQAVTFSLGRTALHFGRSKINLPPASATFEPHVRQPMPGSADLCFIVSTPMAEVEHLKRCGIRIGAGPINRTGALYPITSLYFRDPDGNLLEVASYKAPNGSLPPLVGA